MDNYPAEAVAIAASRGYDAEAHARAIADDAACGCGGSDDISLTHPTNWLTEDEVTRLWDNAFPGIVASALEDARYDGHLIHYETGLDEHGE
jgi:azurin